MKDISKYLTKNPKGVRQKSYNRILFIWLQHDHLGMNATHQRKLNKETRKYENTIEITKGRKLMFRVRPKNNIIE